MKKILTLAAVALLSFGTLFAQSSADATLMGSDSYADTKSQYIDIEDKWPTLHEKASQVTIQLKYTPLDNEVEFYYTCMASAYDQGEAMNTAMAVYEEFMEQNKYKHKTYVKKDKTKFFKDGRGVRMATYISRVRMSR